MTEKVRWSDLKIGLIALASIVGLALIVLMFARVGGVRGQKVKLYVTAASAGGVLKGTEVHLAGKRVGLVEAIEFRPAATDTNARLLIVTEVLESALPLMRRDSYASMHPSGTFIGAPVVELSVGTPATRALRDGDTIPALPPAGAEGIGARVSAMGREMSGVMREFRSIVADVRTARGTAGAIRARGPIDVATFRTRAAFLTARFTRGQGLLPRAFAEEELRARAGAVLASVDTIGTLLSTPTGNIGRFRRDSSLIREMESARAGLDEISAALGEARGTAGRLQNDRALSSEIAALRRDLDALIADVKRNPFRYLAF